MKVIKATTLAIPDIKIIQFARFCDQRGYFTEHYRMSDFENNSELAFMKGIRFTQCNESFSRVNTVRGLHFQWNPYMGKLVRTIRGRMIDMVLDIRKGSPTFGKIVAYEMPFNDKVDYSEWIWVPAGFAHGNYFTEESQIEYFCSGEYSQGCEAGISPLAADIDWSLCDPRIEAEFESLVSKGPVITDKDRNGFTFKSWVNDPRSENFIYGKC
jgi:dTDP-4-dehydrorhamnose 3,5-epimerase